MDTILNSEIVIYPLMCWPQCHQWPKTPRAIKGTDTTEWDMTKYWHLTDVSHCRVNTNVPSTVTISYLKSPTDPRYQNDPGTFEWTSHTDRMPILSYLYSTVFCSPQPARAVKLSVSWALKHGLAKYTDLLRLETNGFVFVCVYILYSL